MIAAVVIAALALALTRYMLIETKDTLPEAVRLGWLNPFRQAAAETGPAQTERPAPLPTVEPTPQPTPVPTPEPVMQNGSTGDEVKALQNRLRELGFMTGSADGRYGPLTEAAVKALRGYLDEIAPEAPSSQDPVPNEQHDSEAAPAAGEPLTEDEPAPEYPGTVDQALWDSLQQSGFLSYRETVKAGSTGRETQRLQTRLMSLGYLSGKADGLAGSATEGAIRAFQSVNGLGVDGVAGEKTQAVLFSGGAKRFVQAKGPYVLKVSTKDQRVYAYAWNSATGSFSTLARTMVCSTGLDKSPTPKGTFRGAPVTRWGYFPKFDVWAQYLYRINGPILFHSVLYNSQNESSLIKGSVYKLGSKASHGCVRLSVDDARWVYNNCPAGTTVTVY